MTDNPDYLLAAVDALTLPVQTSLWRELDHDHEWLAVTEVRPAALIREMRKSAKAEREPIPAKVVETGEWQCLWCKETTLLPTHSTPHLVKVSQEDEPLLDQLEDEIGNSLAAGGSSQAPAERIPVAADVLQLSIDIRTEVGRWIAQIGGTVRGDLSMLQLVRSWYALHIGTLDGDGRFARILREWERRIKTIFDPPRTSDVQGICPACEFAFVITIEDTRMRALQATEGLTYDDTRVVCQVCGTEWSGWDRLNELANATRRLDGAAEREAPPLPDIG